MDVVCAGFNSNVLGDLCTEIRARGLEPLFRDCNRRLTLFAPNNGAWARFFDYFNDRFFSDRLNFELLPIGDEIVLRPNQRNLEQEESMEKEGRNLQDVDENFRQRFLSQVLGYHTSNGIRRVESLVCDGQLAMISRGLTVTECNEGAYVSQRGTCNGLSPTFSQANIVAANGIIHVIDQVMIPSPDGTTEACNDIGRSTDPVGGRAILIATP